MNIIRKIFNLINNGPWRGAGILLGTQDRKGQWHVWLGKRTGRPQAGTWSILGGRSEKSDKSPLDTAIREATEEANLSRYPIDREAIGQREVFSCSTPVYVWSTYFMVIENPDLEPIPRGKDGREFSEQRWFPANALPDNLHTFVAQTVKKACG
jgi:8-oxo-dGTP pyrophosphatase MutT (NUDIX family)